MLIYYRENRKSLTAIFLDIEKWLYPDRLEEEQPDFSGIVRYEAVFEAHRQERCRLEITDADQSGIEVFLNGESVVTSCREG